MHVIVTMPLYAMRVLLISVKLNLQVSEFKVNASIYKMYIKASREKCTPDKMLP